MNQEMNHGGIDVFPQRFMLRVARLAQHTMASCCPPGSWPACHWAIGWDAGNVTGMDALIQHRLGSQFGYGFTMVYHSGLINQRSIFSDRLWANNQVYNAGAILRRVVHHPIQRYIILTPVVMCYRVCICLAHFRDSWYFWMECWRRKSSILSNIVVWVEDRYWVQRSYVRSAWGVRDFRSERIIFA